MQYRNALRALLSPTEAKVFAKLNTPQKIQSFLEALPQHFVRGGEVMLSPSGVVAKKTAHCMEGAVFAAAALAYHGQLPLLLDLQTPEDDDDHVLALFSVQDRSASGGKPKKLWGAISKTNHPVLRYRDPVYQSVRELAMSYFHEYFLWSEHGRRVSGKKTLRAYSKPFDLSRYKPELWVVADSIDWLADPLDESPHSPAISRQAVKHLRDATTIETKMMEASEWSRTGKKLFN